MVPLPYSPPAIEENVARDVRPAKEKTEVQRKSSNGRNAFHTFGESFTVTHPSSAEEKTKYTDTSQKGPLKTSRAHDVTSEPDLRLVETTPKREAPHTLGFSHFVFRRKTAEMASLLESLKDNLDKPEGAQIMTGFRRSLEQLWRVAGPLPKEHLLAVSAVEEGVRNTKWRDLSIGQVISLQQILTRVSSLDAQGFLDQTFRVLHRSRIDIYPSSTVDEDDAEAEAETEE